MSFRLVRVVLALGAIVVLLAALLAGQRLVLDHNPRGPNVLVIVTDDQRATQSLAAMPATRHWFVEQGTKFTRAYATTPVCCPSRASIMTGRYAHNHRTLNNEIGQAEKLDQTTTLQRYLSEAGYSTAMIGRYLNGFPSTAAPPYFDHYARCGCPYRDAPMNINGNLRVVDGYTTRFMADWAIQRLHDVESDDSRPWFIYVAPKEPHAPAQPEGRYASASVPSPRQDPAMRERDLADKPAYVRRSRRTMSPGEPVMELRALLSVDDLIERVAQTLRQLDEERDTLAFFVSDNGKLWGEHGLEGKGVPYQPSTRVPMLMRWSGHVSPGTRHELVGNIDIAPTVLEAAGISPDVTMDGRSLLHPVTRQRLLLEMFGSDAHSSLRWGSILTRRYQYVEYYGESGEVLQREYYDMRSDPWQLHNLLGDAISDNDPDVGSLSRQLENDRSCSGPSCP